MTTPTQYATAAEFDVLGIKPEALPNTVTTDQKDKALGVASRIADSYLAAAFVLPLSSWGDDLREAVCSIAAYKLVTTIFVFQPDPATNEALVKRYDDAIAWLKDISAGRAKPGGVVDSSANPRPGGAVKVYSKTPRGW